MKTRYFFQKLSYPLYFLCVIMCIASCEPGDGDPGPAGPKGDPGEQGPVGPQGETGTANVIYSNWFIPDVYETQVGFNGLRQLYFNKAVPQIDQDILDTGVIQVYAKLNGYVSSLDLNNKVIQLPYTVIYSPTNSEVDQWGFRATEGNLRITFENNKNSYTSISISHEFRYVLIPGAVNATSSVNFADYEAVREAYNILN